MKNFYKILLMAVCMIAVFSSCKKTYDDLYVNNNKPTSVPPSLLLTGILNDMYDRPSSQNEVWDQYYIYNYDYYGNNRYDFGNIEFMS